MTKVAEPGEASKMREAAVAVMLACAAATLAAVILVPRTQRAPAGLVQLLPSWQMSSAIQLFSKAQDGLTVVGSIKVKFWLLAVCRNGRGGVAQRGALRRAARAGDHRDWRALCQVYVPARG